MDDSVKEVLAAGSSKMKDITQLLETNVHSEHLSSNKIDATSQKGNQDETKGYHISDSCIPTIRNLSISISECESKLEVEKHVAELIRVVQKDEFEQQTERVKSLQEYESSSFTPINPIDNEQCTKFPLFSSLHLPLTPYTISTLLNEILKLSEKHPKANLLTLKRLNGTNTTLVPIPEAKNVESFDRIIRRKKWMEKITECIFPSDKNVAVEWLLYEIGENNEDEFVATAGKLGYPILAHKMSATAAAAMWQESDVSIRSQRIILRHMANEFGKRLVVPEKYIYKHCRSTIN